MFESRLRAILDTAVDGIILMDVHGVVTMFNPACERLFGYDAVEVVGANIRVLMPAPYHDAHDGYLSRYHNTGERKIIGVGREVMGRRKDGETFPMDLSVGEASHDGEVFYVGIIHDITERCRAAEVREKLIEELTISNEERSHFSYVASHDLREPIRMVKAFCGLLSQRYGDQLDARGRQYLSLALSASEQMGALVDDLVDFGGLTHEADRGAWFSSGESLGHALEYLQEPILVSGARVCLGAMPDLFGNAIRFQRLMQNLVGNALKYVAPGVTPKIYISAQPDGDCWRFLVSDNGIGIEPRHFERIFEPFKRLHGRNDYNGSGLGLAICRKIVEGFGGRIWVCSAPGGSTFNFTIKICSGEQEDDESDD